MKKLLLTIFFFFLFSATSIIHSANCTKSIYLKPATVKDIKKIKNNQEVEAQALLFPSMWLFAETF